MRDLSTRMIEAVLDGDGLLGVAEIAAAEAGAPVAIVLPSRGLAARAPAAGDREGLADYARAQLAGESVPRPEVVLGEQLVIAGGAAVGVVMVLDGAPRGGDQSEHPGPAVDREEILRAAALASLAEVAVADARAEAESRLRGSFIQALRRGELDAAEVTGHAARLGCELVRGAVALAAEVSSPSPSHAIALVESVYEGSVAEISDGRLYAILPARGGDEAPERTLEAAGRLVARLRKHGPAAVSSFYTDPAELQRAMREAELVLDVISREPRISEALEGGIAASGVYRLLFRALITDRDEVRRFYEDTIEPVVRHDIQYRGELLGTLEEYLARDCNMNATARAIYAHRHTVAYRLDRIRELTGLDPSVSEDRERLGLGVKAYRILAPALPR